MRNCNKYFCLFLILLGQVLTINASEFSDNTFLVVKGNASNLNSSGFWEFLQSNNFSGIEVRVNEKNKSLILPETNQNFNLFLRQIQTLIDKDSTKILPVFITYSGDIALLDSIINSSEISPLIFYLPQGETWPSLEYLIQSNRRIVFFVNGLFSSESRVLHNVNNYILRISANATSLNNGSYWGSKVVNLELFMIEEFDKLPTEIPPNRLSRNLVPDYINFLLKNWTKYGKRPNFVFIGDNIFNFDFIISQLNSFTWINGTIKATGKTLEKVHWRNPDVLITGGKFSFPYRGGEEITLSPFAPGYRMVPEQIIVTGEMEVPESYTIMASPLRLSDGLSGSFNFEEIILNAVQPAIIFVGENYTFSQDIERGNVLRLPENASINLGNPENFGLRNSSFTVSCHVKFTDILEFGDNAVLGNYESEYRRGLHLVLRSGHPYFGLWANDYVSEEKLKANIWYNLVWRYIIETGEQAIFLNGKNIGSSNGHPPFSGTGDIHLGSALSQGASLRGYVDDLFFWNRPLGNEEINRLALNEEIVLEKVAGSKSIVGNLSGNWIVGIFLFIAMVVIVYFLTTKPRLKKNNNEVVNLPDLSSANQIRLFGEFKVVDKDGIDITIQFTPKIKELLLFVLIYTIKNGNGVKVSSLNENLWPGISTNKVANNRAVTLNKLRKIIAGIEGIEMQIQNNNIVAKMEHPLFCDYAEAFHLCQSPGEMSKQQLETFFLLVKGGRFLKGLSWPWLDEMSGFTGNQVIDNLLKLAAIYKKENKLEETDVIARRIIDYDDLSEEAIYLQIWSLQKANNLHMAKFNFNSFRTKYNESMGEKYTMDFEQFIQHFSNLL